jgi:tetratricopeptide (TPR) repeat protein
MRTTASYRVFANGPGERAVSRARWLAREGRYADAESAYRDVIAEQPELEAGWAEYFELLRAQGRAADGLTVAHAAEAQFPTSGFPLALAGAALIELGRYRAALGALERAVEMDPDLALVWHELGVAAHRLGDPNRALLALDRAFALEPHTDTLRLRGRILREAGRYQAAEVAFEGAAEAAEHDEQRLEAQREAAATRRYAFYAPRRPEDLSPAERWFSDTGAVVLTPRPGPVAPSDEVLVTALRDLAADRGWRFGQVVAFPSARACAPLIAAALDAPVVAPDALDPAAVPLVVAARCLPVEPGWAITAAAVLDAGAGLWFVCEHPADAAASLDADVVGVLTDGAQRRSRMPDSAHAMSEAQHPAARCAGRRLSTG